MYYPSDPIENLKGVGEHATKMFKLANIKSIGELLNYFPFRYEDLSKVKTLAEINTEETFVFKGEFKQITTFYTKTKKQITKATFQDKAGKIEVLWFNSPFVKKQLQENQVYMVTCKPSVYGNKVNLVNPSFEVSGETSVKTGRIVPVYLNIQGLYMTTIKKALLEATKNTVIDDFLENRETRNKGQGTNKAQIQNSKQEILNLKKAYTNIHFPVSLELAKQAQDRIALNEVIHIKLHSQKVKEIQINQYARKSLKKDYTSKFLKLLPFKLTKDQELAVLEINKHLSNKYPANILLSGDVGCGKTIVAILNSKNVVENGGRVVYLAPTVILANQIYKEYLKYFDKKQVELVIGKSKTKNKSTDKYNDKLVLIGTHALLNLPNIEGFADFVIIDEQHKFGVRQRAKLIEKRGSNSPHVLTMTATPIPRSLALTYFNELDLVQIKTKPKGRLPVKTKVLPESKRKDCYKWLANDVIKTQSIYYIVPFINQSIHEDFKNVKSLEETYKILVNFFEKEAITVLHGKHKDQEKRDIIDKFKARKGGILLSTQVVEVGVDISDASCIIIESAERFGLASLHQLRGRVGRNSTQSYCFLFTSTNSSIDSQRLKNLEVENNGFKLAMLDLKTRGGGEVFGIRQSGEIDLKFVDFTNSKLINDASLIAKSIYKNKDQLQAYTQNYFTRDFFDIRDN